MTGDARARGGGGLASSPRLYHARGRSCPRYFPTTPPPRPARPRLPRFRVRRRPAVASASAAARAFIASYLASRHRASAPIDDETVAVVHALLRSPPDASAAHSPRSTSQITGARSPSHPAVITARTAARTAAAARTASSGASGCARSRSSRACASRASCTAAYSSAILTAALRGGQVAAVTATTTEAAGSQAAGSAAPPLGGSSARCWQRSSAGVSAGASGDDLPLLARD